MAGGFTTVGQVLGLLGGVRVMPAGAMTVIEKLRAAKSMLPGDMGDILNQVMQQGPGALLQNPMAAVTGALNGQLGGLASQVTAALGANGAGLVSALTGASGLGQALGNLQGMTDRLSGLANVAAGQFGLTDLVSHANLASMFGNALPAGLSLDIVTQPLRMMGDISNMAAAVPAIVSGAVSGKIPILDAVAAVGSMTGQLNGVMNASQTAMSTLQAQAQTLSNAAAAVSMIASGPPQLQGVMNTLIRPSMRQAVSDVMANQLADGPTISV